MADPETTNSQTKTLPDDMHWGINYLREDIQDLRAEHREFRADVKAEFAAVRREMQDAYARLDAKIDSRFHLLLIAMIGLNGMLAGLMTALIKL